jgi:hypothetical protein
VSKERQQSEGIRSLFLILLGRVSVVIRGENKGRSAYLETEIASHGARSWWRVIG